MKYIWHTVQTINGPVQYATMADEDGLTVEDILEDKR